jgi:hypothetical protein
MPDRPICPNIHACILPPENPENLDLKTLNENPDTADQYTPNLQKFTARQTG